MENRAADLATATEDEGDIVVSAAAATAYVRSFARESCGTVDRSATFHVRSPPANHKKKLNSLPHAQRHFHPSTSTTNILFPLTSPSFRALIHLFVITCK